MNPFDLDVTGLLVWGALAHFIADWLLQNDWMARNKGARRVPDTTFGSLARWAEGRVVVNSYWWDRHPAAYVHAWIHGMLLIPVFGFWPGVALALVHLIVDTRAPVVWWSRLIRQTQPSGDGYDVGLEVRFWTDQVVHVATIAVAALIVGSVA